MADHTFRPEIEVLSAADVPRRRHWSDADKLRIVEESFLGHRQVPATASVARRDTLDIQLEIVLRNGRRLFFPSTADPEMLARLLPVLDAR